MTSTTGRREAQERVVALGVPAARTVTVVAATASWKASRKVWRGDAECAMRATLAALKAG
jgi:hypothetical protein